MLEILKNYKERTKTNNKVLLKTKLPDDSLIAEVVCNNNSLLIDNLEKLFADDKAQYLPNTIIHDIKHRIADIDNLYNTIEQQPDNATHVLQALQHIDKLYAYCLQYGLITFGFDGKEEVKIVQGLRNKINDVEADIVQLKKEIAGNEEKLNVECQTLSEKLKGIEKDSVDKINAELTQFTKDSEKLEGELNQQAESYKKDIEQNKQNAAKLLSEIAIQGDTAKQAVDSCTKQMKGISDANTSANQKLSDITGFATQAGQQLTNAQTHAKNANTQLQNATQSAADAKAKDDATAQHLASAKQRQQEIDTFYQEIETHKEEMMKFKKQSEANYNQLKSDCDNKVDDYSQKMESIVVKNQELQEQIKILLQKAVSAGLFGIFKQRQKFLMVTRFVWAGLVFISIIALAIGIYRLASDLANIKEVGLNVAFFIRSGIMVPLIYLMYFTSSQYKKERQAEEEYAFKSAISFSLEPYRDLLIKMRKDHELEADFVKELMGDIFDNPVKRLYRHKGDKTKAEELIDMLSSLAGKIPSDKKKILLAAIEKVILGQAE